MGTPATLRLLASTNNARGDLFTRLLKDLFFALSYDDLRLNVHKSGREVDLLGTHRLEPRRLVAECKAHAEPIGGDDLNKFFGVVSRERDKDEASPVAGYFVSLSGFRETGKEQELETSPQKRVILLDGKQIIDELIRANVLVSREKAVEQAGRVAARAGLNLEEIDGAELLGHEIGYLWAVFYSRGKQRTHFALIHADGTPLAESVATEVLKADRKCKGTLHKMKYLAPAPPMADRATLGRAAVARYCQWIVEECGYIQLDGLPADADLSTFRMRLERLFVPLKVAFENRKPASQSEQATDTQEAIMSVGEFLKQHHRFSLLAKPGGGKSTLLKRLAVAYAATERRGESDDQLPDQEWLPLFLKCRDLRDRAHRPIRELLNDLSQHSGMTGEEAAAFGTEIDAALRDGRALLLIDGLDEISNEGVRTTFANHVRTFLAVFPHVAMVVTSREAGYRFVAGVVASACEQAKLTPFDEEDVRRLCESWHVEVVGNNDKVRSDARQLAATIWDNERIRALAENPLMLTTLLVVRRCIGELPTRRVELYREAVRVLIRTWNTEGFEPMDLDETVAQLSYVACAMMNDGVQRVGHRRLLKLLEAARNELQAELQFCRISPSEFIHRVEYRSSLLMQTGQERIDEEWQAVYEFRHLTFQEYLAASGLVAEQYPGRNDGRPLVELLEPHFEDERWREVIPLAAVLAGRKAEPLITRLTTICEGRQRKTAYPEREDVNDPRVVLLRQCLLDEVQVTPPTLRAALRQMARHGNEDFVPGSVISLRRGKFGEVFQEVAEDVYFGKSIGWDEYIPSMRDLALEALLRDQPLELSAENEATLTSSVASSDRMQKAQASFVLTQLAFAQRDSSHDANRESLAQRFHPLRDALGEVLVPVDPPLALAAAWALVWCGASRLPSAPPKSTVMLSLYQLWRDMESSELRRLSAWAFSTQPLLPRDTFDASVWGDCDEWFQQPPTTWFEQAAKVVLAWYRCRPWTESELASKVEEACKNSSRFRLTARELLATLGDAGRRVLEKWDKK